MLISTICAPPGAAQVYNPAAAPAQSPRLDHIDNEIVEAIRENGIYGAPVWAVLNWLAAGQNPTCRADARSLRLQLWQRLRRLLRAGLVFRFGRKYVTSVKLPRLTVRRSRPSRAGSTVEKAGDAGSRPVLKPISFNLSGDSCAHISNPRHDTKTETVVSFEQASDAGRSLARLRRRQPRRWTGWLHGEHCWRGRLVGLPNGEVAPVIWCCRGRVLLRNILDFPVTEWLKWGALREHDVALVKHPAAVALGRMKRGVRERRSSLKAATARDNGRMPARRGRRGRPSRAPRSAEATS
jgi:hypothetical protein